MVKVGFIVEGDTETIILKRNENFNKWLSSLNIEIVNILDGKGGELFSAKLLNARKQILKDAGATHIILLTDLEDENCFKSKKEKIDLSDIHLATISKKTFEAWFLADTDAIRKAVENENYYCENPEIINNPFDTIVALSRQYRNGRGYGAKSLLAGKMNKVNFDLLKASEHPNCPSAKYFIDKISLIAKT